VHPTEPYSTKCPHVESHALRLSARHAKFRRDGYREVCGADARHMLASGSEPRIPETTEPTSCSPRSGKTKPGELDRGHGRRGSPGKHDGNRGARRHAEPLGDLGQRRPRERIVPVSGCGERRMVHGEQVEGPPEDSAPAAG
jgi:hypothetical protein